MLTYIDTILHAVGPDAAQRLRETNMWIRNYEWQSDFAKKYVGEGEAKGRGQSLLLVLGARGFEISVELRAQVESETDLDVLDEWIRRAATAGSLADVFVEDE